MEGIFAHLQDIVLDHRSWATREEIRIATFRGSTAATRPIDPSLLSRLIAWTRPLWTTHQASSPRLAIALLGDASATRDPMLELLE